MFIFQYDFAVERERWQFSLNEKVNLLRLQTTARNDFWGKMLFGRLQGPFASHDVPKEKHILQLLTIVLSSS